MTKSEDNDELMAKPNDKIEIGRFLRPSSFGHSFDIRDSASSPIISAPK